MYQSSVVLSPTSALALGRRAEWKAYKGKPRALYPHEIQLYGLTDTGRISLELTSRFKSLKFLLTNSKVPRDTKKLVAGVAEKKARVSHESLLIRLTPTDVLSGTCGREWYIGGYSEY